MSTNYKEDREEDQRTQETDVNYEEPKPKSRYTSEYGRTRVEDPIVAFFLYFFCGPI
jgi:hypothetical protein